ncbi:MAG TPA: ferrochelatase [Pirellulales bacterium]
MVVAYNYDAVLIVSFGGPERPEDVMPFLENVVRGKPVPRERLLEVAEHYYLFGGRSPINAQNRALKAALEAELARHGPRLPVYLGNRNWHPLLADTLAQMGRDGVRQALGIFTSAYSSYSSCRQYLENIADAQAVVGATAPSVSKLRAYFNHPGFIEPMIERTGAAMSQIDEQRRPDAYLLFTAHSIPQVMADGCRYQQQLAESSRLVAAGVGAAQYRLVYQSRSGPPSQAWLEPDINDALGELAAAGVRDVVVVPIGFLSDHLEVLFDLDTEARDRCVQLGINMVRAETVGSHPRFVQMVRELICERIAQPSERTVVGLFGPCPDVCPADCCPRASSPTPH